MADLCQISITFAIAPHVTHCAVYQIESSLSAKYMSQRAKHQCLHPLHTRPPPPSAKPRQTLLHIAPHVTHCTVQVDSSC